MTVETQNEAREMMSSSVDHSITVIIMSQIPDIKMVQKRYRKNTV